MIALASFVVDVCRVDDYSRETAGKLRKYTVFCRLRRAVICPDMKNLHRHLCVMGLSAIALFLKVFSLFKVF